MQGVKRVLYTDLYWDSLAEFRNTPYYRQIHENIIACVANKVRDRNFWSPTDEMFSAQKELKGIWHARILGVPLRLLFYKIEGDTLYFGSIGTHADYGWKGKNSKAAERLVERFRHSISRGHVPFPDWDPFRWNDPATLVDHPEMAVLSSKSLRVLYGQLSEEYETLTLFKRKHGERAVEDLELAVSWIETISQARDQVERLVASREMFEKAFRDTTMADCAMVIPSPEVASRYTSYR
ncbi:hypothetical protein [Rhizobium sp. BK176]|uniref:hypothetical protein n=1 Tax=Rhizobium sp. BK176 TaxID=2587071 RepID=UPI00216A39A5|nr:hypothetical protein [Rhizobium sp. BK176]MCS4088727.1 hypothetical protein [Rhizobium sp. BK176]